MRVRFGVVFTAVMAAVLHGVAGGRSISLDWRAGGSQPVEVIDFGPQMVPSITRAEGVVPTPHGNVEVAWRRVDGTLTIDFTVPERTEADVAGGPGAGLRRYGPGRHTFTRAVPSEELVDPTFAEGAAEGPQARDFGFVTSQPFDDASAHYAQTFDLDAVVSVDSVTFFPSGEGFPDSLTIEGGDKPGEFRELARRTGLKSADRKKPLTIDLRTVVGAPDVRYLRLSGDGLVPFSDGKRWGFRFANIRVNFTARQEKTVWRMGGIVGNEEFEIQHRGRYRWDGENGETGILVWNADGTPAKVSVAFGGRYISASEPERGEVDADEPIPANTLRLYMYTRLLQQSDERDGLHA